MFWLHMKLARVFFFSCPNAFKRYKRGALRDLLGFSVECSVYTLHTSESAFVLVVDSEATG